MAKSLWSEVLEGTFDTSGYSNDKRYDVEIESMVTHEPETMVEYVSSCIEGMLAVDTAVAIMEGRCAVQYVQGKSEEATSTMEGVLRNAWETLKEWVKKAYNAIKKFIKKAWNKMKGYINIFKGMVTKYNYVLKGKIPSGMKVDWVRIEMVTASVNDIIEMARNGINRDNDYTRKSVPAKARYIDNNKTFYDALERQFFPNGRHPEEVNLTSDILKEAIRVADDGFDKVYSEAFKIGELTERDILKEISDVTDDRLDKNDDSKASDKTKNKHERDINSWARRMTNATRAYAGLVNSAASLKVRLSVKVCRKVIKAQAQNSSATYGLESSDFSAVMGEIL